LLVSIGDSFETFYRREYRGLVALAYALVGGRQAAEDIAQDALTAAYRNWGRVSGMADPPAYVRRTVANMAASYFRRRLVEARSLMRLAGFPQPAPELDAVDEEFWAAVRRLPRRQAQAIALRYVYDCPVREVADVLGVSEGAVKRHLHLGRSALASDLNLTGAADNSSALKKRRLP
jgi:RNA polymerase sigma-70 factor (ECF subfamily)